MKIPKKFIILKDLDFLEDDSYCRGLSYWSARRGQVFILIDLYEDSQDTGLVRFKPIPFLNLTSPSRYFFRLEDFECKIKTFSFVLNRLIKEEYILILK